MHQKPSVGRAAPAVAGNLTALPDLAGFGEGTLGQEMDTKRRKDRGREGKRKEGKLGSIKEMKMDKVSYWYFLFPIPALILEAT